MSKKLMMNSVNDDVIVLCKDFSPNGKPFVLFENQTVDWDKYELYMKIDVTSLTKEWQQILTISVSDVETWAGVGKFHVYGSPNKIRTQVVNGVSGNPNYNYDIVISNYDKKTIEVIFNKSGTYVQSTNCLNINNTIVKNTIDLIKNSFLTIGSANKNDLPYCKYNTIQLQPYKERGE